MNEQRVEVKVTGVYMHKEEKMPPQHFVLLRDENARRLPIWIGQFEAWAIAFALENDPPERPMSHDFMLSLVTASGGIVTEAAITDLRDETYYASVTLHIGDITKIVDARPSDAIALAMRAKCPIYVSEAVMTAAAQIDKQPPHEE